MDKINLIKLAKWVLSFSFMLFFPVLTFLSVAYAIYLVSLQQDHTLYNDFISDLPSMLLSFYGGFLGGGCMVIVNYFQRKTPEPLIETIAKFVLGGIVGMISFFVVKSGVIVKIIYPKIDSGLIEAKHATYYSIFIISFVFGVAAPKLIAKIKSQV